MDADKILKLYFIENRSRLIDIAAFLDRIGRSKNFNQVKDDFRWIAFQKSLKALLSGESDRVQEIQDILSDPTLETTEGSSGSSSLRFNEQNASGAPRKQTHQDCC